MCWEPMRGDPPAECPALCLAVAQCPPAWHHIARRGLGQGIHTVAAGRIEVEMEDTGPRAESHSQIGACEQGHAWVRRYVRKLVSIAKREWSGSPFVESFVGSKTPAKLRGRERDTALSAYSVPAIYGPRSPGNKARTNTQRLRPSAWSAPWNHTNMGAQCSSALPGLADGRSDHFWGRAGGMGLQCDVHDKDPTGNGGLKNAQTKRISMATIKQTR